jgi:hypothetical protein
MLVSSPARRRQLSLGSDRTAILVLTSNPDCLAVASAAQAAWAQREREVEPPRKEREAEGPRRAGRDAARNLVPTHVEGMNTASGHSASTDLPFAQ